MTRLNGKVVVGSGANLVIDGGPSVLPDAPPETEDT